MRNRNEKIKRYRLSEPLNKDFFGNLNLNITSPEQQSSPLVRLLDTFDWKLFKNGLILKKNKNQFELCSIKKSVILASAILPKTRRTLLLKDIPESELKNKLSKFIGIRALIPVVVFNEQNITYGLLNNDEKTVARLVNKSIAFDNKSKSNLNSLSLHSVRGYDSEFKTIDSVLKKKLQSTSRNPYQDALMVSGRKPGSYSSKFRLELDPDISTEEALKQILYHLINTMKVNENGIKKDIDIEFLHDFRVAVRRARSALSQIKFVFPADATVKLKNDFSKIGKMTNRLRDLDVYLGKKDEYVNMLPAKLRSGIEPVFQKLEKERAKEQIKIKAALNGKIYRSSLEDALNCLETEYKGDENTKNSGVLILPLAKKYIRKKYNKVIKKGLLINHDTPDKKLHELRIECKKLRYLLEFFSSLFQEKKIALIISQLKKLQDNLGEFNDYYVQQESLGDMLANLNPKNPDFANITISVGGLIAILSSKQILARKEFNNKFSEFAQKENRELYGKLFS